MHPEPTLALYVLINATGGAGLKQLDLISFSNIKDSIPGNKNRYYAHTFVAWIFFSFVFYMVMRESIYYINLRQAYLLSPLYANRMSSRTVLFTSVPQDYLNEGKLRRMFGPQVKNLWIANDCQEIEKKVEERDKVAMKLEAAENKLIKLANTNRLKAMKKGKHNEESAGDGTTRGANVSLDGESGSVASRWVQPKQRPTHRLKFLIGKKVDTINWCRSELERIIPEVDRMQDSFRRGEGKFIPSVFVEFYTQTEAQAAYQSLAHHQPLQMSPRFIGINPEEVIWKNLKITWAMRIVRNIATMTFVGWLIIFWAIPVAFVGIISNISALSAPGSPIKFLSFINKIPSVILGVVQGLLPSVLLAVLMALLPIILRLMAKLGGKPTLSTVELRVQNSYFLFQVIQVFLVTTLTSGAAASGVAIFNQPSQATTLLASSLPKASNFYISYFVLQGLIISSGAVLQIVGVILFKVLGKFLDTTPRKMYKRFVTLSGLGWGTVFPVYTLLTVIALTYSIIAPLVLGFATTGLYLIYLAYRYNLLFVFSANIDTKGLVYPRALQQTTTGVYLGIVCLIGLFAISTAIGPLILMIVYLIFLILFHISLNSAIDPLLMYLPKSLQVEEESLMALEDGGHTNGDNLHDHKGVSATGTAASTNDSLPPAPHKQPNFITKFLSPQKYTDYQTLRRLVPRGFAEIAYDPEVERDAFYHPAISSPTPMLWVPRDEMGVSRQECHHSSKVIPMTDEAASFDEKGKLTWDHESARPPIYQEKVYY
ncbi:calcium permeable stress-gated cation channel, partial [Lecanoromycetidae sp. Uapishka_2]